MKVEFKSISYAITVCDEAEELKSLLDFLLDNIRNKDEVVVQVDSSNTTEEVRKQILISSFNFNKDTYIECPSFKTIDFQLNKDFAKFKNNLKSNCSKDYIFQIDADEIPSSLLIQNLPRILQKYPEAGLIHVPRVNTVTGITEDHIKKWGWTVNHNDFINWPDWQPRIFKNNPNIYYSSPVHETILGYEGNPMFLPDLEGYALFHPKTIARQEKQNNLYKNLLKRTEDECTPT
tara:strand:- start:410 stop:1111 length:702 start_codon:yes stop_codon:yes gene_type:complete